jgi:hypothetical protein
VRVSPVRPDGRPWAGARSFALDRIVDRLDRAAVPANVVLDLTRRLPRENQPTLIVTAGLPDGRGLQSAPRRGAYATLDGAFVVASNAYDDRTLSLRVVHDDGGGRAVDAGVVTFRIGDLVARRELSLSGHAVGELRLEADPADLPDGAYAGLQPIPDGSNLAAEWSVPTPASAGLRVVSVEAVVSVADRSARAPGAAAPALTVEIAQRGRVVYRSPPLPGRTQVGFTPAATYLFVEPLEAVTLRVLDGLPGAAVAGTVRGEELMRLGAGVTTPGGSAVRLRLEPRRAGPDAGARTARR